MAHDDGTPDFHALRGRRRGHEAVLYAFDLIEHDGNDLRDLPLIERKFRLFKLIGRAKRRAIQFVEHLTGYASLARLGYLVHRHLVRDAAQGHASARWLQPDGLEQGPGIGIFHHRFRHHDRA
jgi:hypothetical protein